LRQSRRQTTAQAHTKAGGEKFSFVHDVLPAAIAASPFNVASQRQALSLRFSWTLTSPNA
jgi:hypothetical protein